MKKIEKFEREKFTKKLVEIKSPFDVRKILFARNYPGYTYRRELVKTPGMRKLLEMVNCYSEDSGFWIGEPKITKKLCRDLGLRKIQKGHWRHSVCSVGFNEKDQEWFGWSHRAICGFKIGDRIFEENYGNEKTPFLKHGRRKIKNMKDAKVAALNFAKSVS